MSQEMLNKEASSSINHSKLKVHKIANMQDK